MNNTTRKTRRRRGGLGGVSILDACADPDLFGPWFKQPETWRAWFCFLRALFGLPLDDQERVLFQQHTGRADPPAGGTREAWLVVGRRGGKSMILAVIAVFLAVFVNWRPFLSPGERGTVMIVAADRRQARTIFRYVAALLKIPMLAPLIERETADSLDLNNGVTVEILTANFRTVRGYTLVAALCDELAFWRNEEAANPDDEILAAIRPAQATVPGAMLLCASSPYARRGALWEAYRRNYGKADSNVLVWKAPTLVMNPTVPQSVVNEAIEADPASAAAEYLGEFRSDVETFVSRDIVEAAVVPGRHELPRVDGVRYVGFVDPSGGSADSMALAIAHCESTTGGAARVVVDVVRERKPPFSPDDVTEEFADLLKAYGCGSVYGDRFGGLWPRERFQVHGVDYNVAVKVKSEIYRDLLPMLNSHRVDLPDSPRAVTQFCSLERRTARGGRDSIDHAPGGRDDVANAIAGAIVMALATAAQTIPHVAPVLVAGPPRNAPGGLPVVGTVAAPCPAPSTNVPAHWLAKNQRATEPWRQFISYPGEQQRGGKWWGDV
jgi:hypothetical protein